MVRPLKFALIFSTFLMFFAFLGPSYALEPTFSDVNYLDKYEDINPYFIPIEYLAARDVIHGHPDGSFLPEEDLNRAELVKLIVAMKGIHPDPKIYHDCFPDVTTEWFAKYVCYAKKQGWIQGYSNGYFKPAKPVDYPEMLKIVLNPLFGEEIESQSQEDIKAIFQKMTDFYDNDFYDDYFGDDQKWYSPYFALSIKKNISKPYYLKWKSDRNVAAELVFHALLVSENNWEMYHDSLRDSLFIQKGLEKFILNKSNCYPLEPFEFDFYLQYLESEYGLKKPYHTSASYDLLYNSNKYDFMGPDQIFETPFLDWGYFCDLGENGFVFSNFLALNADHFKRHLMFFDKKGQIIQDQSADCKPWTNYNTHGIALYDFDEKADYTSLELLHCFLVKEKNDIYHADLLVDKLEHADAQSFQLLKYPYSTDGKNIYHQYNLMNYADPATFEVLEIKDASSEFNSYAKDENSVFYRSYSIEEADPATFELLSPAFARDSKHVFKGGILDENYDANSFEVLNDSYFKDKNGVYYFDDHYYLTEPELVEGADSETFSWFKVPDAMEWLKFGGYGKDKNHIFYNGELVESSDSSSFTFLGGKYAKDKNQMYYLGFSFGSELGKEPFLDYSYSGLEHFQYELKVLDIGDLQLSTAKFLEEENALKDATGYTCQIDEAMEAIIQCKGRLELFK